MTRTAEPVTLSGDELDLLGHLLGIDELPVVLASGSRFDSASARDDAFDAARATLGARGLMRAGHPHPRLVGRLSVLARPTTELALRWHTGGTVSRMCLAQGPGGVALAVRASDSCVLSEAESADPGVVLETIGRGTALDIGSVSAPTAALSVALRDVTDPPAVARRLTGLGIRDQDARLLARGLGACRAHAEIVVLTHRAGRTRTSDPVTVFDTDVGRVLGTTSRSADGLAWSTLGPGGDARVRQAVRELLVAARGPDSS